MRLSNKARESVQACMTEHKIPGVAVAVVQHGALVAAEGFGFRNLAEQQPMTADTIMPLASLTKSFTAVAVMQLAEAGKVRLDEPVVTYLPTFRVQNHDAARRITVRMLLCHLSGLGRSGHMDDYWKADVSPYSSRLEMVEAMADYDLQSPPGEVYAYSNEAYVTCGALVDALSDLPFEQHVERRVLAAADMAASSTHVRDWRAAENRASGYTLSPEGDYKDAHIMQDPTVGLPAGLLCSTARDLARYLIATMDYVHSPLLPVASLREMHQVSASFGDTGWGYGLGWDIKQSGRRKVVSHGGSLDGVATRLCFLPEEQLGVVVLTNLSMAPANEIAELVAGAYLGEGVLRHTPQAPLPFVTRFTPYSPDALAEYAGEYHGKLSDIAARVDAGALLLVVTVTETGKTEEYPVEAIGPDTFMARSGLGQGSPVYFRRREDGSVGQILTGGGRFER
jgi:CubicO group peptidase (beta-lactamase class C family)